MSYSKKEKYTGALIGAAIGDALGWPNEQNSKNISKNKNSIRTLAAAFRIPEVTRSEIMLRSSSQIRPSS